MCYTLGVIIDLGVDPFSLDETVVIGRWTRIVH